MMDTYAHALEDFNRANHSDGLREMQMVELAPAETFQPDDAEPVITIRFGLGLAILTTALLGSHLLWVRAGMPGPAEILSRLMETLNV